jgi:hypothetical protein
MTSIVQPLRITSADLARLADALTDAATHASGRQAVLVSITCEIPGGIAASEAPLTLRTGIDRLTRSLAFVQGDLLVADAVAVTANAVCRLEG